MQQDLESIRQVWQHKNAPYIRTRLAEEIHAYPPEVQRIIAEVARERGIIEADQFVDIPPASEESAPVEQSPVISSSLTFFYKYIFSTLWITGFGFGAITALINHHDVVFLAMWLLGTMLLYVFGMKLKRVELHDDALLVSNYFRQVAIPLSAVVKVSESRFINIHPVWITFRQETEFGRTIMFMPTFDVTSMFFLSHPIVQELRRLAQSKISTAVSKSD